MTPTNRGGQPSRVILDPVTLEPVELIVESKSSCAHCGNGSLIEVFNDLGQLVRREANGQLCWHYRANQSNRLGAEAPLTNAFEGGIIKRERR